MNLQKKRFEFGKNWKRFLKNLSEKQIENAKKELENWLGDIKGKTFLDIGCGSGLHSLAARMLGAKVYSFDYDSDCVECAIRLKERFFPNDPDWVIELGDILDIDYLKKLEKFDIVYSWGVLHHTGDMWRAMENIINVVKDEGYLYLAIYNYQVYWTRYWSFVKYTFNKSKLMKYFWIAFYFSLNTLKGVIKDIIMLKNPLKRYKKYKNQRGMSIYTDLMDWLGGYPFDTSKPEKVFDFYFKRGFVLLKLWTAGGGIACNQFLFRKNKCVE